MNKASIQAFKISLGPVGQFADITNFFKVIASSNTLGKPSNLEDNTKRLQCLMYL